ncbi:MAG: 3-oxoacyl-ACP reductase FabG [Thalassobaculaceae bacterium]|nr:3-oxoacyl-ACP reductase FabG [Thalassobaculaceae bacterium]
MRRTVLVTGGGRGIGREVSLRLARSGFDLSVHYHRNREAAEAVAEEARGTGVQAHTLQFDLVERDHTCETLSRDMAEHGAYYGVVFNAGMNHDAAFPAMTGEEWDSVLHTNLDGFYNVLHPITMPMVRARLGGRIVVMSSVAGIAGNRGQVNYSAAKGGLIAAAKSLAIELAKRRITVNCIAPGFIETEMTEAIPADLVRDLVPARRMGRPEEVAGLVAYLFSDDAEYITRQVISVNGGML